MTKYVTFESDPISIKRSGDNIGYIYNPKAVMNVGESFRLPPGEKFMIIPQQPDNLGPWKQYRTMLVDGRFIQCKESKTMVVMVENRWLHKSVSVVEGITLEGLMELWGISHELSYATDKELEKIENHVENNNNNNSVNERCCSERCCQKH